MNPSPKMPRSDATARHAECRCPDGWVGGRLTARACSSARITARRTLPHNKSRRAAVGQCGPKPACEAGFGLNRAAAAWVRTPDVHCPRNRAGKFSRLAGSQRLRHPGLGTGCRRTHEPASASYPRRPAMCRHPVSSRSWRRVLLVAKSQYDSLVRGDSGRRSMTLPLRHASTRRELADLLVAVCEPPNRVELHRPSLASPASPVLRRCGRQPAGCGRADTACRFG